MIPTPENISTPSTSTLRSTNSETTPASTTAMPSTIVAVSIAWYFPRRLDSIASLMGLGRTL